MLSLSLLLVLSGVEKMGKAVTIVQGGEKWEAVESGVSGCTLERQKKSRGGAESPSVREKERGRHQQQMKE